MYTQCPECLTAFRVTAALLQQASGRVRCGNCGHSFSALEHLSEEPPTDTGPASPDANNDDGDALADTFNDDLSAFDDVRIEDTGVEWRVIDEDDANVAAPGAEPDDNGTGTIRWHPADDDSIGSETTPPVADQDEDIAVDEPRAGHPPDDRLEEKAVSEHQETLDLPRDTDEIRYDDNTPLPDDFDDTSEPEPPRRRASDQIEPRSAEFDERQVDLGFGEPDDWRDLLDEFGNETGKPAAATESESSASTLPADIDTQFDLQALELGIDLSGTHPAIDVAALPAGEDPRDAEPAGDQDETDDTTAAGDYDGAIESEAVTNPDTRSGAQPPIGDADADADRVDSADGTVVDDDASTRISRDVDDDDPDLDEPTRYREKRQREDQEREAEVEAELAAAYGSDEEAPHTGSTDDEGEDAETERPLPPEIEEEKSINLQIDQDLLRLAEEQGFGATMSGERKRLDDSLLVETIVMEGDFVKSAQDKELDAVIERVGGSDSDPRLLLDTYIKSKDNIRGGRRKTDPASYKLIATVAVLGILLIAQLIHSYRDTLATYGAFNHTVGSVYRLFGNPLVPDWNVKGWQFESTNGSTDDSDQVLTIRSRIANDSGQALPYPLLHVALTDRFEEIIGSRVLQPAEYLAEGIDPADSVAPGDVFAAVITVEGLSGAATGFKLNVCYREDSEHLRCATEDFRN